MSQIITNGGMTMAYETKVILALLAQQIAQAKTVREAYGAVKRAANVEGLQLPTMDELLKEIKEEAGESE
jgi:hypothetical protein